MIPKQEIAREKIDKTIKVTSEFTKRNQVKKRRSKCKTEAKGIEGVELMTSYPRIKDVDLYAKVTAREGACDKEVGNKLELYVTWVVAPESMTRLIEDVRRHWKGCNRIQ